MNLLIILLLESEDRLSISIGNLPPKQDVFLKVTYISELVINILINN